MTGHPCLLRFLFLMKPEIYPKDAHDKPLFVPGSVKPETRKQIKFRIHAF